MQIFIKTITSITSDGLTPTPAKQPRLDLTVERLRNRKTLSFCILDISPSDSIRNVKEILRSKEDILISIVDMRLFNGAKELPNIKLVKDCELEEGSLLHLIVPPSKYCMTIFIEGPNSKASVLQIEPSDTIKLVKSEIEQRQGIPRERIILLFTGKELEDGETLNDYGVQRGSVLQMKILPKNLVEIFIETLYGKAFVLKFDSSNTIETVKIEIQKREGISHDQIRLFFAGIELENSQTLISYNIENQSMLHMVTGTRHIMQIFVNLTNGESLNMEVEPSHTIESLKRNLLNKVEIPSFEEMILIFFGKIMKNSETIGNCNIIQRSVLYLVTRSKFTVQIFIKTPTGKTLTLDVKPLDVTRIAKAEVQMKEGILASQLRLFFVGKELDDEKTFSHYNIEKGSLLHTSCRPKFRKLLSIITPGNTLFMEFQPSNITDDVKVRLQDKMTISTHKMKLCYNDRTLSDGEKSGDFRGFQ